MSVPAAPREPRIDLLRGIAVLLVMLLHYSLTYRLPDSWLGGLFTPKAIARVVMNGNYGVTIFFVISGYLITTNTVRRNGSLARTDVKRFYLLRAARILPLLLIALAVILVFGLLGAPSFVNKQHGEVMPPAFWSTALGSVLTFWHNVLMRRVGYFNYSLNIYWSLSVEEVFYLVFPLACAWLRRWWLLGLGCALVALGPVYRWMHADNELDYLYGYLACADALALGCITAVLAPRLSLGRSMARVLTLVGAIALAVVHWQGIGDHEVFGFSGIAFATALLLASAPRNGYQPSSTLTARVSGVPLDALRWMGRHSYELYLFHIVVLGLMRDAVPRDVLPPALKLPWLLVFLLVSIGVAHVLARYVAEPANRYLRGKWA